MGAAHPVAGLNGPDRSAATMPPRCSKTRSTGCTRPASNGRISTCPELRIRGWSYGGFLAALAVLRRPDVFHVAIAGAPVTDDRLYDTHYTERYLGRPDLEPDNYAAVSLIPDAFRLTRPLMLIHGLSDDNVVVAHTLRLSAALLAAGREHTVLPLTGATHMANDEAVAENLLLLELAFIRRALADIATG